MTDHRGELGQYTLALEATPLDDGDRVALRIDEVVPAADGGMPCRGRCFRLGDLER